MEISRAALLIFAVAATACGGSAGSPVAPPVLPPGRPILDPAYRPTGMAASGATFVHLFEWKWPDIAVECETVLGPLGFAAVQVSPPQEHAVIAGFPWWQRYQPVSYSIERSRSGTAAEFRQMVSRCRSAGVSVYVDAVINHMTAGAGTGSNGTAYTKYNYPGLYTAEDFHPPCALVDYQSAANVQDCELLGLSDLNTGKTSVREKIAGYLLSLARIGVAGFRIDAAKHIQPVELDSILARVNSTLAAEGRPLPYYFAEVIDNGREAVRVTDYFGLGFRSGGAADITEFKFRGVSDKFSGFGGQRISDLNPVGPPGRRFSAAAWGLIPADKAVVFIENHDTQRSDGIGYRDGNVYRLANVWMLAQPYGYPSIMSGYGFDRSNQSGRDMGPPSDAAGATRAVACAERLETAAPGQWVCEHRDPWIARMVAFRRAVAGTELEKWWDNGGNAIAFSRGTRGFVAVNRESFPVVASVGTGLAAGTYCELLSGGRKGAACAGIQLVIGADGAVQLSLAAGSAVAIHLESRL